MQSIYSSFKLQVFERFFLIVQYIESDHYLRMTSAIFHDDLVFFLFSNYGVFNKSLINFTYKNHSNLTNLTRLSIKYIHRLKLRRVIG